MTPLTARYVWLVLAISCALKLGPLSAADVNLVTGNVDLTINSATAGLQPDPVSDQSSQLEWDTEPDVTSKKITVQSDLASPLFTLKVEPLNISQDGGISAGQITISASASDLIVGIPPIWSIASPASCVLRYTASATAAAGTGTEIHTITYTIIDE